MSAIVIPFPARPAARRPVAALRPPATRHGVVRPLTATPADRPPGTPPPWAHQAGRVLDHVAMLLDEGRAGEVVELCQHATRCLLAARPDIPDRDVVASLLARVADLHLRACRSAPPEPDALASYLAELASCDDGPPSRQLAARYADVLGAQGSAHLARLLAGGRRRHHPSGR